MSPLLIQPLPFRDADRLVWIQGGTGEGGLSTETSRAFDLRDWKEQARSFDAMSGYFAFFEYGSYNLIGAGEPERLVGVGVVGDFLDLLGVQPQLGRNFNREEILWNGPPAVILTHDFWERRFAADPAIVGGTIDLDGRPTRVVGVLPRSFDFASTFTPASHIDFLLPFPVSSETNRWGNTLAIVGRLRPGVTVREAQTELRLVNTRLAREDPSRGTRNPSVEPLRQHISGHFRTALLLLAGGAVLVLLVACANLSSLLLARGRARAQEMAVRSALGAGRGRLVAQLLVEAAALALCGGVLGVLLAVVVTRWVSSSSALAIPMVARVGVDARVAAFSVAVTLLTGIVVGIAPALQAARGGEAVTLRDGGRGASTGRRRTTVRELLVVFELAIAFILLIGGGLLLRSFIRVLEVDLGFQPDGAVAWQLHPTRDFANDSARLAFFDDVARRVAALPGVKGVGLTDTPPLGRNRSWDVAADGVAYEPGQRPTAFPRLVDSPYLQVMRIPLVEGRYFTADDDAESTPVIILNETAARTLFPGGGAVGHAVRPGSQPILVVGVVKDVRHQSLEKGAGLEMYLPYTQVTDFGTLVMVVRSSLPAASLSRSVASVLHAVDPGMPADDFEPLDAVVDRALSPRRFILAVLGTFAATALLLASLGIYAVLSYTVSQRSREIGIRMALGESAGSVQRRVVGRTLVLAAVGVAGGAAVAFTATRLIGSLLYGVSSTDLMTFGLTAVLLLLTAVLAGYAPARRASRTDPAIALRGD
jgi:predicted permease